MNRDWRPALYFALGAVLVVAAFVAPAAWATPGQSALAQTIPTRTPTGGAVPPTQPPASDTPVPPSSTPQPGSTSTPTAVQPGTATVPAGGGGTASAGNLTLTIVASQQAVWLNATVTFTATLTNTGRAALQQPVLENVIPSDLEPGRVISGAGTWQGRTLRTTATSLAPGGRLVVVYTARVASMPPGQGIVVRATGRAVGPIQRTASVTLGAPPSELPVTGGSTE